MSWHELFNSKGSQSARAGTELREALGRGAGPSCTGLSTNARPCNKAEGPHLGTVTDYLTTRWPLKVSPNTEFHQTDSQKTQESII